jgi:Family of unknown function (DUF6152)
MKSTGRFGLLVLLLSFASAPLLAHHVPAAKFDPAKPVTLKGTVTKIDWLNPHVHLFIDVPSGDTAVNWAIELPSTVDLRTSGWSRDTLKIGDPITVQGISSRDGSNQLWANSVVAGNTGKKVFALNPPQPPRSQPGPTPRWPDGQPRLGPPLGEKTGYWGFPGATTLVQTGANVQADQYGMLRNLADIDKVAPFQRWARDLYELRQRNFLKDDPMFVSCKPQSGPRIFQLPYGVQFLEERDHKRIRILMGAGNQNWRFIYLDGRPQTGDPLGNADNPLYFGHARGKWEGDTLVVDTKGFNDSFWFSNGGLPHTQQLHLIERFSRPDLNTLRYEVMIDDPGAYTRNWTSAWTLKWVGGEELPIYYCQDNRP